VTVAPITLAERLSEQQRQDRRQAVRALLRQPLLTAATAPEDLALVKRHAKWLKQWFAHNAGWPLIVEAELARLHKRTVDTADATRPAWVKPGEPFSRRRYVLLCLTLAALERMDRQTTLHGVAQAVVQLAAEDPALAAAGIDFTLKGRSQRRDLVVAVRFLLDKQLLTRVHGSEERFLADQGDALYRIDRTVLSRILDTHAPPSLVTAQSHEQRLGALVDRPHMGGDEARRQSLRHRVARRLLDDTVLYFDELDDDTLEYVHRSRAAILPQLEDATGLHAELRAEGIALADDRGTLTDLRLPEEGTEGHVTLLLAEYLASRFSAGQRDFPLSELTAHMARLIKTYGRYWRKAAREPGAEVHLTHLAVERLQGLGLARRHGDSVEARPAVARYRLVDPVVAGGPP